ncbi:MAG: hypothetical protein H7175_17585 [Burkholderiales bacterium]|nr:hypothetical protein [Anaerolineae bacterium]
MTHITPTFTDQQTAIDYIFRSIGKTLGKQRGLDESMRDTSPTRRLLMAHDLLAAQREYTVVTGSKGKGSTTVMTAKILEHLGHTVGTITSPHLVDYRERIRINGRAIPQSDFLRILNDLAPEIDEIEASLMDDQYFSPQGIFLAMALRWFDEQAVNVAVLEVGRGGRFDDIALVPNRVSLFTPIILEHVRYLGPTLERIAWHKAGIIKPNSYAYSVPQAPEVLDVLLREAEAENAEFFWFSTLDLGQYVGPTENGIRMSLGRYGEFDLPLLGHYETENATLAVQAAGNMHGRLSGISHGSPEYVERIREGLSDVIWPGRLQKLQDNPPVYVDGAINTVSARSLLESLGGRLTKPVVTILAVPEDRNYPSVYAQLGAVSDAMVLTESTRNITIHFPSAETALEAARPHVADVTHTKTLSEAMDIAKAKAGSDGTILIVGAQPLIGDAMELYGLSFEQI